MLLLEIKSLNQERTGRYHKLLIVPFVFFQGLHTHYNVKFQNISIHTLAEITVYSFRAHIYKEGYPSKPLNSSLMAKDSLGQPAKFHRYGNPITWGNLMRTKGKQVES